MLTLNKPLILASNSPRRKELLSLIGLKFTVIPSNAEEDIKIIEPETLVCELSKIKAGEIYNLVHDSMPEFYILAADTAVFCENQILGKPKDLPEAFNMLKLISGRSHDVFTGIAIMDNTGKVRTHVEKTVVFIDELTPEEINCYISRGESMDKAGAYGIQGSFAQHIKGINGCFYNVMGLPLNALNNLFKQFIGE